MSTVPASLKAYNEYLEKIREAKTAIKENGKEVLKILLRDVFDANPHIAQIKWSQYIPAFNDGEPCEFTVTDAHYTYTEDFYKNISELETNLPGLGWVIEDARKIYLSYSNYIEQSKFSEGDLYSYEYRNYCRDNKVDYLPQLAPIYKEETPFDPCSHELLLDEIIGASYDICAYINELGNIIIETQENYDY
jgi:hypothetical protein